MQREGAGSQATASLAADSHPVALLPRRGRPLICRAGQRGDLPQRTSELPQDLAGDGGRRGVALLTLNALGLHLDEGNEAAPEDLHRAMGRRGQQLRSLRACPSFAEHPREVPHRVGVGFERLHPLAADFQLAESGHLYDAVRRPHSVVHEGTCERLTLLLGVLADEPH